MSSEEGNKNVTIVNSDQVAAAAADAQKMPPPRSGAGVVTPLTKNPVVSDENAAGTVKAEEGQGEADKAEKGQGEASKVGEGHGEAGNAGKGHEEASKAEKGHGESGKAGKGQADATDAIGPDTDRLGRKLSNLLQMFNQKRTKLDTSCKEGIEMSLTLHQLQRQLACERSESRELHQQLELAMGASRRWQEERGGLAGAAARLKVQLAAAHAERDLLKDEGRALQLEKMQLMRQKEEMEGQLQGNVDYTDGNNNRIGRLLAVHEALRSDFQKLVADQRRFEQTVEAAKTTVDNCRIHMQHHNCTLQKKRVEQEALETEIARLRAELMQMTSGSATDKSLFEFTKEDEVSVLQEMVSDLQRNIGSTQEKLGIVNDLYANLINTTLTLSKKEEKLQEKYTAELARAAKLEVTTAGLIADIGKMKDNLRSVELALLVERERAKKAECVERGVQCDMAQIETSLIDVEEENEKSDAAPQVAVDP